VSTVDLFRYSSLLTNSPTKLMNFPPLVFGTWRLADKSSPEPLQILSKIKTLISLGITTFDLADIYGGYTYEELFGNALKLEPFLRSEIILISKCDIQYPVGDNRPGVDVHYYDTSEEYIVKAVERYALESEF
jgi:predicted oxidoreductase